MLAVRHAGDDGVAVLGVDARVEDGARAGAVHHAGVEEAEAEPLRRVRVRRRSCPLRSARRARDCARPTRPRPRPAEGTAAGAVRQRSCSPPSPRRPPRRPRLACPAMIWRRPPGESSSPTSVSSARSSAAVSGLEAPGASAAEGETTNGAADQPPHRMPDGVQHAPQLALATLVQHHAQPGAAAIAAQQLRLGGRGRAIVQLDALAQAGQRRVVRDALDERLVGLVDAVAGVRQAVRQLAVGGEQQQPLAVAVEPPDVPQAGRRVVEQVEHRLASALVPRR